MGRPLPAWVWDSTPSVAYLPSLGASTRPESSLLGNSHMMRDKVLNVSSFNINVYLRCEKTDRDLKNHNEPCRSRKKVYAYWEIFRKTYNASTARDPEEAAPRLLLPTLPGTDHYRMGSAASPLWKAQLSACQRVPSSQICCGMLLSSQDATPEWPPLTFRD